MWYIFAFAVGMISGGSVVFIMMCCLQLNRTRELTAEIEHLKDER